MGCNLIGYKLGKGYHYFDPKLEWVIAWKVVFVTTF
jgi:hypothetical protein